jgi:hypothetical protein
MEPEMLRKTIGEIQGRTLKYVCKELLKCEDLLIT